ncbi:MAG: hypothetical protein A2252_06630 [Elusimicrobia bacterium RIFOXYA2_FULL_39_19]|nr:MAG: hypothetical protein A2252_06630 [Elusimicrobia bacterium RIFOXYA2_FULL_39_19]
MSLLLKTNLRKKLLAYSFTHPDEAYYLRELALFIDEDPGNLSRELKRLEEDGLYSSTTRGKLKFYSLNKKYPLYAEYKKIIFKTEGVEGSLKNLVGLYKDITFACIYGSYAKDKEKKTSDIDLLLVGKFPVNDLTNKIRELESKLNREINFNYYSKEEFEKERKKAGSFLDLVLNGKKIVLRGSFND